MKHEDHLAEISAYIDGELMPDEIEAMRVHLASCGECAAEYETLRAVSRRVKEAYERPRAPDALRARLHDALREAADDNDAGTSDAPSVDAPAPVAGSAARETAREVVRDVAPMRRPRLPWAQLIAAGLVIAVASSASTLAIARRSESSPAVANEVLASHIRSLMPGHLTDVTSNDTHNVKPWFNGRLDLSPNVPRLDSLGYPLVGGRLDYTNGRPVAAVVYMRRQHIINVFSWPTAESGSTQRVMTNENGYHLMHWRNDGAEYWVASDVNAADLEEFVNLYTHADGAVRETTAK